MQNEKQANDNVLETAGNVAPDWPGDAQTVQFLSLDNKPSGLERIALGLIRKLRNIVPILLLLLADIAALIVSGLLATWLSRTINPLVHKGELYPFFATYCGVLILGYMFAGLYSGIARSSPDELKRLSLTTTMIILIVALITYASKDYFDVYVSTFLIAWGAALITVPLARATVRAMFASRRWWGHKAIIMSGNSQTAGKLVQALKAQPRLGIKPVAILTTERDESSQYNLGLPQLHGARPALENARAHGIGYAIIALSDLNEPEGLALIRHYENFFKHWLIMPYFAQSYSLWVHTRDLNGMLGLEVTNRLHRRGEKAIKRALDISLTLLGGIVVLPLCLLIALAIKLDSRGPALYTQERLGKNGKPFMAYKFRSMIQNADSMLRDYLAQHPELEEEWKATQKLKSDPRITKLGRFLRRTSLDELPQLINVLRGEMSLVGPRPIVADEIDRYDWVWDLYKRARPGITGQWQISGRNDTSYKERTAMDAYYIRNWSIWLDIHILARTFPAVLRRRGAY